MVVLMALSAVVWWVVTMVVGLAALLAVMKAVEMVY